MWDPKISLFRHFQWLPIAGIHAFEMTFYILKYFSNQNLSVSVVVVVVVVLYFHIFFFSRITVSISTKLGTKHPWVTRIKVSSNEGPQPFSRGDDNGIAKIYWRNLKIIFPRTTGPISTKFRTNHPWVKGI